MEAITGQIIVGGYICYNILATQETYISIVKNIDDNMIHECVSLGIYQDDKETEYYLYYNECLNVQNAIGLRYATEDEKKLLDQKLKDNNLFYDRQANKIHLLKS